MNFRKMWIQKFGSIPANHEIMFKDGNHSNCNFNNLYYGVR
jgi:hypothetical protein